MPRDNKSKSLHAQRMKEIRSFVNFDFDLRKELTPYQKSKIKKYHDEITALTARPYQVYRSKDKTRLSKVQKFAQHEKQLAGLKVAFVPTNGKDKAVIKISKKGQVTASTHHITTRLLELDTDELLNDPKAHVNKVITRDKAAKRFSVLAGRYEIPVTLDRGLVAEYVANLTAKYSNDAANNYHGNWLHGLAAHHYKNQDDFSDYMREKQKAKLNSQRERRNKKARNRYHKNK